MNVRNEYKWVIVMSVVIALCFVYEMYVKHSHKNTGQGTPSVDLLVQEAENIGDSIDTLFLENSKQKSTLSKEKQILNQRHNEEITRMDSSDMDSLIRYISKEISREDSIWKGYGSGL